MSIRPKHWLGSVGNLKSEKTNTISTSIALLQRRSTVTTAGSQFKAPISFSDLMINVTVHCAFCLQMWVTLCLQFYMKTLLRDHMW